MPDGGTTGPKRPPRPGPNYVWNGKRWVKKAGGGKPPTAPKPPRMTYPAPTPKPTGPNPLYSSYLGMAPDFRWGGRTWGADSQASFESYLRSKGINPAVWYRNHPNAAKTFDPVSMGVYANVNPQLMALDAERQKQQDYYGKMMSSLANMSAALMPLPEPDELP